MPKMKVLSTRIEVEDFMLTSADPRTKQFIGGRNVEYWLFCSRIETRERGSGKYEHTTSFVHEISAPSEDEANEKLAEFVEREGVSVVEKRTPRGIKKVKTERTAA